MGTALHDTALINVHNLVTVFDGGQTMSDDKGSPALQHGVQALLQRPLSLHVNAGSGLVQYQDGGI